MNAQHTPGSWAFSFESIDPGWVIVTAPGGLVIANVNANHRQEASARLISAEPDLLESLERARSLLVIVEGQYSGEFQDRIRAVTAQSRAAIAKALGESE